MRVVEVEVGSVMGGGHSTELLVWICDCRLRNRRHVGSHVFDRIARSNERI